MWYLLLFVFYITAGACAFAFVDSKTDGAFRKDYDQLGYGRRLVTWYLWPIIVVVALCQH